MSKDKKRIQDKLDDLIFGKEKQELVKWTKNHTKEEITDQITKTEDVIDDFKISILKGNKSDLYNSEIEFVNDLWTRIKYKVPDEETEIRTILIKSKRFLENQLKNVISVKKHYKDLQEKLNNIDPKNIPNMKKDERDEQVMYTSEAIRILKDIEKNPNNSDAFGKTVRFVDMSKKANYKTKFYKLPDDIQELRKDLGAVSSMLAQFSLNP